jgi:formate dehydrogenase subunit gamma
MPSGQRTRVLRHDLLFRMAHWSIFVEGAILVVTGFQLGGIIGGSFFFASNVTVHVLVGMAFIATAAIYAVGIVSGGDYRWVGLRRIPYSLRFIISETRGWFGLSPKPANPIAYDTERQEYKEKLVPSVIVVFWAFALLGVVLALTGLALAFPQQFGFVFVVTDFIGGTLTGVTGMAFMLTFHRLVTFALVVLVMMHVYASFIFGLVSSMITGKRNEKIASPAIQPPPELRGARTEGPDPIHGESYSGKTVVVGIGNRYLRDDGIGVQVADELVGSLGEKVLVRSCRSADISLLAQFAGASKVVLVDALKSGAHPGTVSRYTILPNKNPLTSVPGLHSLDLRDVFDIATQTGLLTCPVTIVGVEPKDISVGEGMSDELIQAIPRVLSAVIDEVGNS